MLNKIFVSEIAYGETYQNAEYQVTTPDGQIDFKIGEQNQNLDQLLDANGVDVACLITACNPLGQQVAVEVNLKANHSLELAIQAMGLPYYPGHGNDPKGAWKEGSYLMMGIDPVKAIQLGDLYQQNAVVWISKDAPPELMWLR